jgi:hypothetical protein
MTPWYPGLVLQRHSNVFLRSSSSFTVSYFNEIQCRNDFGCVSHSSRAKTAIVTAVEMAQLTCFCNSMLSLPPRVPLFIWLCNSQSHREGDRMEPIFSRHELLMTIVYTIYRVSNKLAESHYPTFRRCSPSDSVEFMSEPMIYWQNKNITTAIAPLLRSHRPSARRNVRIACCCLRSWG